MSTLRPAAEPSYCLRSSPDRVPLGARCAAMVGVWPWPPLSLHCSHRALVDPAEHCSGQKPSPALYGGVAPWRGRHAPNPPRGQFRSPRPAWILSWKPESWSLNPQVFRESGGRRAGGGLQHPLSTQEEQELCSGPSVVPAISCCPLCRRPCSLFSFSGSVATWSPRVRP